MSNVAVSAAIGSMVQIDEEQVRGHVDEVVRRSVEETLNRSSPGWGSLPQSRKHPPGLSADRGDARIEEGNLRCYALTATSFHRGYRRPWTFWSRNRHGILRPSNWVETVDH